MKYVSLFSGIEAATLAFKPLGFQPIAFSEIEPFPNAVLAHHYPDVPNLGDITQIDWNEFKENHGINTNAPLDLVIGGSPCQSFSVAGDREGLAGQSRLMFEYIRAVRELCPRWCIWENVPGALSSDGGDAFRQLLEELADIGYLLAWRVLDAQFFGVAQRRRRVFLVGHLGGPGAVEVLFEPESLRWDYPSNRKQRETLTARHQRNTQKSTSSIAQSSTLDCRQEVAATLKQSDGDHSPQRIVSITGDPTPKYAGEIAAPLTAHNGTSGSRTSIISIANDSTHPIANNLSNPLKTSKSNRQTIVTLADGNGKTAIGENMAGALKVGGEPPCVIETMHLARNGKIYNTDNIASTITTHLQAVCLQGSMIGRADHNGPNGAGINDNLAFTLNTVDKHAVAFKVRQGHTGSGGRGALAATDMAFTIATNQDQYVATDGYARYLTPLECERLQGMPDNYTRIPYRGKPAHECPDAPRYKALGNSIAVPVLTWIGQRIQEYEKQQDI